MVIQDPFVHDLECNRARPWVGAETTTATWWCPGCGRTRSPAGSWQVEVHNRTGAAHPRRVRLCGSCVGELAAIGRLMVDAPRPLAPGPGAARPARSPLGWL